MRGATWCSFIIRLNAIVEHAFMTCESWDPLVTSMNVRLHSEHPQRVTKRVTTETRGRQPQQVQRHGSYCFDTNKRHAHESSDHHPV